MPNDERITRVTFRILGVNFSPNEVSEILGVKPDSSYEQGDLRHGNPRYKPYEQNGWHITAKIDISEKLETHINSLLDQISPNPAYLKAISENNLVEFYCSIFSDKHEEWINLSSKTLHKMSKIGAGVSIAVYLDDI